MNWNERKDSKSGFSTKHWGKCTWQLLHLSALNQPLRLNQKQKQIYYTFLRTLGDILPCRACRDEYKMMISKGPLKLTMNKLSTRDSVFKYTVDLHTTVNKRLGKKYSQSLQHWRRFYERLRSQN